MGWRVNPDAVTAGTDAYTNVSDVDATITASGIGTADAGTDTYLQYQLTAQFSDPPGINYSTVLLFTATSP